MRLIRYAVVAIVALSGAAFAQNHSDQPPGNTNTKQGSVGWQAPINHRQLIYTPSPSWNRAA